MRYAHLLTILVIALLGGISGCKLSKYIRTGVPSGYKPHRASNDAKCVEINKMISDGARRRVQVDHGCPVTDESSLPEHRWMCHGGGRKDDVCVRVQAEAVANCQEFLCGGRNCGCSCYNTGESCSSSLF